MDKITTGIAISFILISVIELVVIGILVKSKQDAIKSEAKIEDDAKAKVSSLSDDQLRDAINKSFPD